MELPESPAPDTARLALRAGAALTAATVVVFSLGLAGDFVWDDVELIVGNAFVRDPARLGAALTQPFWHTSNVWGLQGPMAAHYYRPLVTLAYALLFRVWGPHAAGFHAVNLALHLACVWLAFGWLRRRLAAVGPGDVAVRAAGLGAGLFALHPSRPESVTWISGCTDLWMTLFVLLGLRAWDHHRTHRDSAPAGIVGGPWHLAGAALAFAVATLAKEPAVVVPAALLADAVLLSGDATARRTAVRDALVLWGTTVVAFSLRYALPAVHRPITGSNPVGAAMPRVLATVGYYLTRVVWPVPPSVQVAPTRYDAHGAGIFPVWSVVLGALGFMALAALAGMAFKRPRWRPWLADTLWFLVPLAPVLNLVPLRLAVLIAPRFLYLPLLGVCAVLARAATVGLQTSQRNRAVIGMAGVLVLAGAGATSLQQVTHLLTDDDLWTYEYSLHPDDLMVLRNVAMERSRAHRYPECFALLRRGVALAHGQHARQQEILLSITLAAELVKTSRDADQTTLVAVRTFLDDLAGPPGTLATLDAPPGRVTLALDPTEQAWVTRQLADPYRLARAAAHARTLSFATADRLLVDLIHDQPRLALAWRNLLLVHAAEQRWDDALDAADHAHALLPTDAVIPMLRGRIARARTETSVLTPGTPRRAVVLATLFTDLGQRELARRTLAPVLAVDPTRADAVLALARAEAQDGRVEAARAVLARALSMAPDQRAVFQPALDALPVPGP